MLLAVAKAGLRVLWGLSAVLCSCCTVAGASEVPIINKSHLLLCHWAGECVGATPLILHPYNCLSPVPPSGPASLSPKTSAPLSPAWLSARWFQRLEAQRDKMRNFKNRKVKQELSKKVEGYLGPQFHPQNLIGFPSTVRSGAQVQNQEPALSITECGVPHPPPNKKTFIKK